MDPLSALIGGGAQIIGSLMNTSSQQAINQQNLQAAQYVNLGNNLPSYYANMVRGANAAGLNPLAVLGQRGPEVGFQAGSTSPGAGLEAAGRTIAGVDPHAEELAALTRQRLQAETDLSRQNADNAVLQGARMAQMNEQFNRYVQRHPWAIPEGLTYPTTADALEELRTLGSNAVQGQSTIDWVRSRINQSFDALKGYTPFSSPGSPAF